MEPEKLPPFLQELSPSLTEFRSVCFERGITPAAAALAWCLTSYPDASVLFGAETERQVLQNLEAIPLAKETFLMEKLTAILPPQKEEVLSPLYWSR
jgi:aryl-alcohol dehydrogenase-like predicted oxidoreductase